METKRESGRKNFSIKHSILERRFCERLAVVVADERGASQKRRYIDFTRVRVPW